MGDYCAEFSIGPLDAIAIALDVLADAVAEWRQRRAGRAAEPEIRAKLHADRIDANPDHASAWLASQGDFDSNLAGLCGARVRFELNVPHDAVCFGHKVEAALIDLGPKDLDIAYPVAPKALQKIADEPMLDHVLARARQR